MKKKNIFSVLLVLTLVLGLVGCGKKKDTDENANVDTETQAETVDTQEPEQPVKVEGETGNLSRQQQFAKEFFDAVRSEDTDSKKLVEMVGFSKDAYIDEDKLAELLKTSKVVNDIKELDDTYTVSGDNHIVTFEDGNNIFKIVVEEDTSGKMTVSVPGLTSKEVIMLVPRGAKLLLDGKEIPETYITGQTGEHSENDVYKFSEILRVETKAEIKTSSFGSSTYEDVPMDAMEWDRRNFSKYDGFTADDVKEVLTQIQVLYNKLNEDYEEAKPFTELKKYFGPNVSDDGINEILKLLKNVEEKYPRMESIKIQEDKEVYVWGDNTVIANIEFGGTSNLFDGKGGYDADSRSWVNKYKTSVEVYKDPETGEYLLGNLIHTRLYDFAN